MKKKLELYVHIPFCAKKCAYCDFLSFPAGRNVQESYVDCLIEEIRQFELAEDYQVSTVFFGGGTPSILLGEDIVRILSALKERFPYWGTLHFASSGRREEPEITIECNPGTMAREKLSCYNKAGINRLSIGLQSAQDSELALLGRIHSYEQFLESFSLAREVGFSNINVDLMSALPGQSMESWRDTLHRVCRLSPEHISAYSLIIEEGTPFCDTYREDAKRRESGEEPRYLPSEDTERQMYEETKQILESYGYQRYEISNYAKEGYACRHNIGYWNRTDYVGFGLGASSLQNPLRYKNTSVLSDYLERDFSKKELLVLTKDNQIEETMFLGLRMTEGVSLREFKEHFSCPAEVVYGKQIRELKEKGLLEEKEGRVMLTEKGVDVSNGVLAEFLFD